jgi:hypothetical protein
MRDVTEYRKHAEACREMAKQARRPARIEPEAQIVGRAIKAEARPAARNSLLGWRRKRGAQAV